MKKLLRVGGFAAFCLIYPLLFVYLRIGTRTRVLIMVDGAVLLTRSWLGSGKWQLPGGGVHCGEEPLLAAIREVQEETGITLTTKQLQFFYKDRSYYKGLHFDYSCYYAELAKRPTIKKQMLEVSEIEWLPLKDFTERAVTKDTFTAVQNWLKR